MKDKLTYRNFIRIDGKVIEFKDLPNKQEVGIRLNATALEAIGYIASDKRSKPA